MRLAMHLQEFPSKLSAFFPVFFRIFKVVTSMTGRVQNSTVGSGAHSRLNTQELAFKGRLELLSEFEMAGYQALEMRTFRGVVIRRAGSVRGLWTFADGHYRWLPVGCNSEPYATAHEDRALRHMMLIILKGLLVRRAVRKTMHPVAGAAAEANRNVA